MQAYVRTCTKTRRGRKVCRSMYVSDLPEKNADGTWMDWGFSNDGKRAIELTPRQMKQLRKDVFSKDEVVFF